MMIHNVLINISFREADAELEFVNNVLNRAALAQEETDVFPTPLQKSGSTPATAGKNAATLPVTPLKGGLLSLNPRHRGLLSLHQS